MKEYQAWKIVDTHPQDSDKILALFHGTQGTREFQPGVWMRADEKMVTDGSCATEYLSGWHVLLEEEHAHEFIKKRFRKRLERLRVIPCTVKGIRRKEHARGPVWLARYIKI